LQHPREYLTQQSAFEAVGAYSGGLIDIEELHDIEEHATPCPGSCGGGFPIKLSGRDLIARTLSCLVLSCSLELWIEI
jgi:hypothetical protein